MLVLVLVIVIGKYIHMHTTSPPRQAYHMPVYSHDVYGHKSLSPDDRADYDYEYDYEHEHEHEHEHYTSRGNGGAL